MNDLQIIQRPLKTGQFYSAGYEKKSIFLHHTAGTTAESALKWWDQTPEVVGTAYVVERDGRIFQAFDDKKWGFHLGVKGDDNRAEKESIGIELVARGWLVEEKGKFFHYPLFPNKSIRTEVPKSEVWSFDKPVQGYLHYHSYTPEQIRATVGLVAMLIKKHKIQVQKDFKNFYKFNPDVAMKNLAGIWSHTTVRKDKTDIVPHKEILEPLIALLSEFSSSK